MESTATLQDGLERNFRADNLNVYVYDSRPKMGKAAAADDVTKHFERFDLHEGLSYHARC